MFSYVSTWDADMAKSLGFLVKSNQGMFKSEAQSRFILRQALNTEDAKATVAKFMGVPVEDGQSTILISASTRWANYGSRSIRRCEWVYVLDTFGVVAQYKLKFIYHNGGRSSSVDDTKTELVFRRADNFVPIPWSHREDTKEKGSESKHIADVGDKVKLIGTVVNVHTFDKQRIAHWDSSYGFKTTIKVGDDIVLYWGMPNIQRENGQSNVVTGDVLEFTATIKAHGEFKGQKQTTISRPKFKLMEMEVA